MTLNDADDAYYLLHFVGKGYGAMAGVEEYVVITQDPPGDHAENHGCPGFTLQGAIKVIHPELCTFPTDQAILRRIEKAEPQESSADER